MAYREVVFYKLELTSITGPRRVNRFVYWELGTGDVEAAKKFYTGLLGWDFRLKKFEHFEYHSIYLNEGSEYQFAGMMERKEAPSAWSSYISVENIAAAAEVFFFFFSNNF